jgi:hypothetical protein
VRLHLPTTVELLTPLTQAAWQPVEIALLAERREERAEPLDRLVDRVMDQRDQLILHRTGVQPEREHATATA